MRWQFAFQEKQRSSKFYFYSLSVNIIVSCGNVRRPLATAREMVVASTQFLSALATSKAQFQTLFIMLGNPEKIQSFLNYRIICCMLKTVSLSFGLVFSRGLCDVTNQGQLNSEQFALAMYLIHQKVMGVDPPQTLSPEMVPPSMRTSSAGTPVAAGEATVGN